MGGRAGGKELDEKWFPRSLAALLGYMERHAQVRRSSGGNCNFTVEFSGRGGAGGCQEESP